MTENQYVDPSTVSPWPTIIRYGLIGGLGLIVFGMLGIITGFSSPANLLLFVLTIVIMLALYVVLMVVTVKKDRNDNLGGFISLGRAFTVAFCTAAIAGLILAVFNVIYMGLIDPEYMLRIGDDLTAMYEGFGMNEDQIEKALADAGADQAQTIGSAAGKQASGYITGAIIGAVFAIIVAAIMKKVRPQQPMA